MKKNKLIIFLTLTSVLVQTSILNVFKQTEPGLSSISNPGMQPTISGDAIKIYNNSSATLKYFYSNKITSGKSKFYEHTILDSKSTWDWAWSDDNNSNLIEFESYLSQYNFLYVAILFNKYIENTQLSKVNFVFSETIYWTTSNSCQNSPNWNSKIWNSHTQNVGLWNDINLHTMISFNNCESDKMEVNWNNFIFYV